MEINIKYKNLRFCTKCDLSMMVNTTQRCPLCSNDYLTASVGSSSSRCETLFPESSHSDLNLNFNVTSFDDDLSSLFSLWNTSGSIGSIKNEPHLSSVNLSNIIFFLQQYAQLLIHLVYCTFK